MSNSKNMLALALLLGLPLLYYLFLYFAAKMKDPKNRIIQEVLNQGLTTNQSKLIVAQAQHETGNFTSPVFLEFNNCFGMRPPNVRRSVCTNYGSDDSYAHYVSIEDSVRDLLLWMSYVGFQWFDTPDLYCAELKRHGYFTDDLSNYANDVSEFYYA